jgi:hypothetical protein
VFVQGGSNNMEEDDFSHAILNVVGLPGFDVS